MASRGETNAFGGKSTIAPTIELIAGNYSDVKMGLRWFKEPYRDGALFTSRRQRRENLTKALTEMNEIMGNIWSAVYNLVVDSSRL